MPAFTIIYFSFHKSNLLSDSHTICHVLFPSTNLTVQVLGVLFIHPALCWFLFLFYVINPIAALVTDVFKCKLYIWHFHWFNVNPPPKKKDEGQFYNLFQLEKLLKEYLNHISLHCG